jgi:hypothetical protein
MELSDSERRKCVHRPCGSPTSSRQDLNRVFGTHTREREMAERAVGLSAVPAEARAEPVDAGAAPFPPRVNPAKKARSGPATSTSSVHRNLRTAPPVRTLGGDARELTPILCAIRILSSSASISLKRDGPYRCPGEHSV